MAAYLTATEHLLIFIPGNVGQVSCPRKQRDFNRQPFGYWDTIRNSRYPAPFIYFFDFKKLCDKVTLSFVYTSVFLGRSDVSSLGQQASVEALAHVHSWPQPTVMWLQTHWNRVPHLSSWRRIRTSLRAKNESGRFGRTCDLLMLLHILISWRLIGWAAVSGWLKPDSAESSAVAKTRPEQIRKHWQDSRHLFLCLTSCQPGWTLNHWTVTAVHHDTKNAAWLSENRRLEFFLLKEKSDIFLH